MRRTGVVTVAIVGLLPLAAAFPFVTAAELQSAGGILILLGRAAGILGLSLFLLAGIQAARLPGLDRWFGGLPSIWRIHHILGALAFALLLLHPILLSLGAAPASVQSASAVLLPPRSAWSLWVGWAGLLAMMIFLAPTFWFFGRPDYQRWKLLHSTAGLATLFALAHTLPLSRAVPGLPGRVIWLLLGASSIAAFVYRSILAPRFARKPYRITAVDSLAPRIVELTLAPEDGLLQYRPGQFVYLTPLDPKLAAGRNEEHPFTLSSAPEETVLRIAVRSAGDATAALQKISVGSRALVEGPYGDFFATERNDKMPELWLAGGIGLAPFLSRGRSLARGGAPRDIYLIYCVEDESRAYFLRELEEIRTKIPNLRVAPHFFRHEGPLTADFIAAHCPDFMKRAVYVCGPPAMIQRVRLELAKRAPSSQIRSEDFAWL